MLVVVNRPHPEGGERELVILCVLGEMGVEPHIEPLSQFCTAHHEVGRDGERGARCQRNLHHRAVAWVVVTLHCPLRLGENVVLVTHRLVGGQATLRLAERH